MPLRAHSQEEPEGKSGFFQNSGLGQEDEVNHGALRASVQFPLMGV